MKEEWLPVKGFEDLYEVSNLGRVRSYVQNYGTREAGSLTTEHKLMKGSNARGYRVVELSKNGRSHIKRVHRLVAEVFVENEHSKPYVNHIDGVKDNNFFENLEWTTHKENENHSVENNLDGNSIEVIVKNKKTNEKHMFASMARASKFMGRYHGYVSWLFGKGRNENEEFIIKKARKQK